jgi:hypothetical protein
MKKQTNIGEWNSEQKNQLKNAKQKQIAVKRIMTKFDIKIKWN